MSSKGAAPTQVYEDFVPSSKLDKEEHIDTIHLNLQGFKREQLRVVVTSTGILKISGQRPIGRNKWQRFQTEFPVAENCDRTKISAKFENGILHVRQPKLITSSVKKDKEMSSTLAENAPAAKRQKTTLRDEFRKQDNADIDTPAKEEPKKTSPEILEQKEDKSLAEPSDESSSSSSSSTESESESSDDEMDDETIGYASCLAANLKNPRNMMIMTLAGLLVLGISLYIANERSH